jgi:hypothetical protein
VFPLVWSRVWKSGSYFRLVRIPIQTTESSPLLSLLHFLSTISSYFVSALETRRKRCNFSTPVYIITPTYIHGRTETESGDSSFKGIRLFPSCSPEVPTSRFGVRIPRALARYGSLSSYDCHHMTNIVSYTSLPPLSCPLLCLCLCLSVSLSLTYSAS